MALEPLPPEVPERTVRDLLARAVARAPDAIALIAPTHLGGERRLTYRELDEASSRLAGRLAEHGIGKGDRVAILLDQEGAREAHIAYHAAHKLGAINVPLNTRYVARELAYVLGHSAPAAVTFSPRFAPTLQQLREVVPDAALLEAGSEPTLGESFHDAEAADPLAEPVELAEEDDADWIFTSGTTGNPKAVALTHANSVACGYQAQRLWGLDADSVEELSGHTDTITCLAYSPDGKWLAVARVSTPSDVILITDTR
jgi:acyl-CoA synthetase (AMP-forming)/AMP-acid ligase II